jgi:hypothetical protein
LLKELAPEFERASSHKLAADLATPGLNADRVAKGVPADVVLLLPRQAAAEQTAALYEPAGRAANFRAQVAL